MEGGVIRHGFPGTVVVSGKGESPQIHKARKSFLKEEVTWVQHTECCQVAFSAE